MGLQLNYSFDELIWREEVQKKNILCQPRPFVAVVLNQNNTTAVHKHTDSSFKIFLFQPCKHLVMVALVWDGWLWDALLTR